MTLSTTVSRNTYLAVAGTYGPFAYTFRVFAASDLRVIRRTVGGAEQVLAYAADYTVTGVGNASGTVTLVNQLLAGETLVIRRVRPLTQERSIQNQGAYFPNVHEAAWDDLEMQLQQLDDRLRRAPSVIESLDPATLSLGLVPETGKALVWQSPTQLGNSSIDTTGIALPGEGRTVATVTAYLMNNRIFNPFDYGAVGNGIADDTLPWQNAIDSANTAGGGIVSPMVEATFKITNNLIIKEGVRVHLANSILNLALTGPVEGVALRDHAAIEHGTVNLTSSTAIGGTGGNLHVPIVIGTLLTNTGYKEIEVRHIRVSSILPNHNLILVTGDSNNVLIENIRVEPSANPGRVVLVHWGWDGLSPPLATTHPFNIHIRNIYAGSLTQNAVDAAIVFISAAHNISVSNIYTTENFGATVYVTAGDYGYTLAAAAVKPLAMQNITVENVSNEKANGYGVYIDGRADNAAPVVVYSTPVLIRNCFSRGSGAGNTSSGFRCLHASDAIFLNCTATEHRHGFHIEENSHRNHMLGCRAYSNYQHGFLVDHASGPSDNIIERCEAYLNGKDGVTNAAGVFVGTSVRTKVLHCTFGHVTPADETTQRWGIRTDNSVDATIKNNHVRSCKAATGVAYSLSTSEDYTHIWEFDGNNAAATVASFYGGVDPVPFRRTVSLAGNINTEVRTNGAAVPPSGTWRKGDKVWYENVAAGGVPGAVCTTGGVGGAVVWKAMAAVAA